MKRLCFGLIVAMMFLGARAASATTFVTYHLHGASCFSITSGLAPTVGQFGVNAGSSAINVVCPLVLPSQNYTSFFLEVVGYNRNSSDHLSCSINATDTNGGNLVSAPVTLNANQGPVQINTNTISTPVSPMPYIPCHLPAQTGSGLSHLTDLFVQVGF